MKKLVSTLLITTCLAVSSAHACEKHLSEQLEALKPMFKKGAKRGFAALNKKGLSVKVSNPKTDYVVCYELENEGKDVMRVASSKSILPKENITSNENLVANVRKFFEHADGKTLVEYTHHEMKKEAKVVDVHTLDSKFEEGKAICAAVSSVHSHEHEMHKHEMKEGDEHEHKHEHKHEMKEGEKHEHKHEPKHEMKEGEKHDHKHEPKHEMKEGEKHDHKHETKHEMKEGEKHEHEHKQDAAHHSQKGQAMNTEAAPVAAVPVEAAPVAAAAAAEVPASSSIAGAAK